MSEKLHLQWKDFQNNVSLTFGRLREENDFSDVTLACEDGKRVDAHKMVLAASSPFFEKILKSSQHPHPIIFLTKVKEGDLSALMDFLYYGETNVAQDHLDSFLAVAEELKIKGLTGRISKGKDFKSIETNYTQKLNQEDDTMDGGAKYNGQQETTTYEVNHQAPPPDPISQELQELNEKIFTMMERKEEKMPNKELRYACKHCGKEGTNGTIRRHIESNHLELAPFPCKLCEKTCKSSRALREHKNKYHESKVIHDSDLPN